MDKKRFNLMTPVNYRALEQGTDYGEETTYVIGHKRPDTDTVCAAIAYAELKNQLGVKCEARVSGKLNNETKFILNYFGYDTPPILENAAGKKIALIDHNTYSHSIDGMRDAEIVEVLDHHGIGDAMTSMPIIFKGLPVGASSTIVFVSYVETDVTVTRELAGIMAGAILSDTNNLTSSTTTDLDRDALYELAKIAGIDDIDGFYLKMQEEIESFEGMSDTDIFYSDYKEYDMTGHIVGIACVKVSGEDNREELKRRLTLFAENENNSDVEQYIMLSDRENDLTELVCIGENAKRMARSAFNFNGDSVCLYPMALRKKDVTPALMETYKRKYS